MSSTQAIFIIVLVALQLGATMSALLSINMTFFSELDQRLVDTGALVCAGKPKRFAFVLEAARAHDAIMDLRRLIDFMLKGRKLVKLSERMGALNTMLLNLEDYYREIFFDVLDEHWYDEFRDFEATPKTLISLLNGFIYGVPVRKNANFLVQSVKKLLDRINMLCGDLTPLLKCIE